MDFAPALTAEIDEVEIITRVCGGSKDEFRLLMQAHQELIYAMIFRQVANDGIAQELAQDTFLKAYINLAQFRKESRFSTWLTRIALNVTNSYFSSKRYRQHLKTVSLETSHIQSYKAIDDNDHYDEQAITLLYSTVGKLKPKIREAFVLCALEQKSYEEAAEILEIPIGTVRSRLHKARIEVKRLYFKGKSND